jgi:hypothetical protein
MNTFKLHLFVCFVAILVSNCCVSLAVHFISGKHDASALGNGISAKRGNINPAAVISVLFLVSYLYFTKKYYNQHLLSPSTFEMINEKLLRENGNLKDLVVQTSADLEREKSNQDNLVHHNELINSDNAALQSRVEAHGCPRRSSLVAARQQPCGRVSAAPQPHNKWKRIETRRRQQWRWQTFVP